jgi:iron complex transport system ATP-binding protein
MILTVNGAEFCYNSHPVLQGVNFTLERGRILAVLGVNGAGKSTLLKCVNKILGLNKGVILLNGKDLRNLSRTEVAQNIGYVPQRYDDGQLTVFDMILLGRKPYIQWAATEQDLAIVEQVLELMHLKDFALRSVENLSGGEAQKVVIARALAQEPDLLLLDEPTSNLDLKNQLEVTHLLRRAVEHQGLAAIVSSHDLNLALRFADFFLFLKDGRVHTLGDRTRVTSEVIREVYGVDTVMGQVQGHPVIIPMNAA